MARSIRLLVVSVVVALALVVACRQIALHGGYAPYSAYRAQVDALLAERLALTEAPEGLAHDLAWTPSGVQQVWGLGVPAWQLPFELVGRAVGVAPFPDRVALVAWLALMVLVLLHAFAPRDTEPRRPGWRGGLAAWSHAIGALLVTALLPPLITLLRGRVGVYEEAAIYAYGAAMILLGGLIALGRTPAAGRYLALAAFAGLTGLIRPTVWFYGLAAVIAASALLVRLRGRAAVPAIVLGAALFVAGGGLLYATNAARFGRGSEFGHRLNIEALPGNVMATRFSYPFEHAGTVEAAEELIGSLFDGPERRSKRGYYQTGLHVGQSAVLRWREYYFTTFSWPYVPAIVAGLVLAALAWWRRGDRLVRLLGAWAALGGGPLFVFYLHSPSVSSRYQVDLAPAIAALLLVVWRAVSARWPLRGLIVLVVAWGAAVATSKLAWSSSESEPVDHDVAAERTYELSRAVALPRKLPAAYDLADRYMVRWLGRPRSVAPATDASSPASPTSPTSPTSPASLAYRAHPARLGNPVPAGPGRYGLPPLYENGTGWNLTSGNMPPATLFYVDSPEFIVLDVIGPADTDWEGAVRVAVGLDHLALTSVYRTATGAQLLFADGHHPGLQIVFIAFGPDSEIDQAQSTFGLRSIRWHDAGRSGQ